uniref:Uncharacterized protein n=1 Tax=Rhizophora mucronata TaxID=61149 RepID=A0A2P2NEC8_RHIMU
MSMDGSKKSQRVPPLSSWLFSCFRDESARNDHYPEPMPSFEIENVNARQPVRAEAAIAAAARHFSAPHKVQFG